MSKLKKSLLVIVSIIILIILYGYYNFTKMLNSGVRTRSLPTTQDASVKLANNYESFLNSFINSVVTRDYISAYNLMTEESKNTTTLDQFTSVMSEIIGDSNNSITLDKITPSTSTLSGRKVPIVKVQGLLSRNGQRVQFDLIEKVTGLEIVYFDVL